MEHLNQTTPSQHPVLDIQGFCKRYGDTTAVRDLTLTVEPGDIFGFIGHNGAGKTTLIRSIVGAQRFEGGTIRICGHDVVGGPLAAKALTAYVPDNPDVYEFMTVGVRARSGLSPATGPALLHPSTPPTVEGARACRWARPRRLKRFFRLATPWERYSPIAHDERPPARTGRRPHRVRRPATLNRR